MKIPKGYTEDQILEIIDRILKGFCYKFRFGYFEEDDIYQEGFILAMEGLEEYNATVGPVENFIRVHVRNRLINFKRKEFSRYEPPCISCPFYDPYKLKSENQCSEFVNKDDCEKLTKWKNNQSKKENLIRPINVEEISEDQSSFDTELLSTINFAEIKDKIDKYLSVNLREDFLKMLDGIYISKERRELVRNAIRDMGVLDGFEDR